MPNELEGRDVVLSGRFQKLLWRLFRFGRATVAWFTLAWAVTFVLWLILAWQIPDLGDIVYAVKISGVFAVAGFFLGPLLVGLFLYAPVPMLLDGVDHISHYCRDSEFGRIPEAFFIGAAPAAYLSTHVLVCAVRKAPCGERTAILICLGGTVLTFAYFWLLDSWFETNVCAHADG